MGGFGSGRNWYRKKMTVENCLVLDVGKLQRDKLLRTGLHITGILTWANTETGEKTASIGYELATVGGNTWIKLIYTIKREGESGEDVQCWAGLITTPLPWGGIRWSFQCPDCDRPCRKLYLPNGGRYFACRLCYRLTYTSSQDAHRWDTLARSMGMTPAQLNAGLRA